LSNDVFAIFTRNLNYNLCDNKKQAWSCIYRRGVWLTNGKSENLLTLIFQNGKFCNFRHFANSRAVLDNFVMKTEKGSKFRCPVVMRFKLQSLLESWIGIYFLLKLDKKKDPQFLTFNFQKTKSKSRPENKEESRSAKKRKLSRFLSGRASRLLRARRRSKARPRYLARWKYFHWSFNFFNRR